MTLCTICCRCGRWYGPWYEEPHPCMGQWEIVPGTNKWIYNPCRHLRCESCGKGEFPLPCEGERKVLKAPRGSHEDTLARLQKEDEDLKNRIE